MMGKYVFRIVICLGMVSVLTVSASAKKLESGSVFSSEKASLLGSPDSWVMGPATGLPSILGWRVERFLGEDMDELPLWLAGLDFSIAIPGGKLSVERRLQDGHFYAGLGGRILYFPYYGNQKEAQFYSLSIPLSYRSVIGTGKWVSHVSLSVEVYTNDFKGWRMLPALQIAFLSNM